MGLFASGEQRCPSCSKKAPREAKFCPHCGAEIVQVQASSSGTRCVECGEAVPSGAKFCPRCGRAVQAFDGFRWHRSPGDVATCIELDRVAVQGLLSRAKRIQVDVGTRALILQEGRLSAS